MNSDAPLKPGEVFNEIARRREKQEKVREELQGRGLSMADWHEWMAANEEARKKGMA